MNTMQSQLKQIETVLPNLMRDARKVAFDRAATAGQTLMLEATIATRDGKPWQALKAVLKNRYAVAAFLAKTRSKSLDWAFHELELMIEFWREKMREEQTQHELEIADRLSNVA